MQHSLLPSGIVCAQWALDSPRLLARRVNTHWRVDAPHGSAILRRYGSERTQADIQYELWLADQLALAGWPTPWLLTPPTAIDGHVWVLMTELPGTPRSGPEEAIHRGRLLATFHLTTGAFPQVVRSGSHHTRSTVFDPGLDAALRNVEQWFPENGRILRWHLEMARRWLNEPCGELPTTVIHGDFAKHNLLFLDGELTGLLDFEASTVDLRIADFALSWRGKYDDVVTGYREVSSLTEAELYLMTPMLWAWVFKGIVDEVNHMRQGKIAPHGFDWQVRILLRRTPLMGSNATPYRSTST